MERFCCLCNILVLALASYSHALPVETNTFASFEKDPELTGGFFEGDMIIDLTRNGLRAASKRWPKGVVRYKIDKTFGRFLNIASNALKKSF